jgi:uncharacterized protein involved in outer membrane biogenesis
VQATLLGVSIAIIVALVAALVGPYFVDWSAYRTLFETEAGRLIGAPVRVEGPIDVRLLPTPSLVLRQVEAGAPNEPTRLRARELSVELALGPVLRGKWQVAEARLAGLELQLRFDPSGRVDWPLAPEGFDPEQVSIGRLTIEDGRAVLESAASGSRLIIDNLRFEGEVRSLLGPIKGAGSFASGQSPYQFELSAGRLDENATAKLHLSVDPLDQPLTIDTDGALNFSGDAPEFIGTLNLARPAGVVDASGHGVAFVPWSNKANSNMGRTNRRSSSAPPPMSCLASRRASTPSSPGDGLISTASSICPSRRGGCRWSRSASCWSI